MFNFKPHTTFFEKVVWGKNLKVKRNTKIDLEPQEIFLDALSQKQQEKTGISEKKIEVPISKKVLQGVYLFFLIMISIFFIKTCYFQIIEGQNFSALAQGNKFKIFSLNAQRGIIYDRNGVQMVFNRPSFDLICHKNQLPRKEEERIRIFSEISQIIEKDTETLKQKIDNTDSSIITISDNLPHQTLILLETKINDFSGFEIKNTTVRDYKDGEIFSHIIGYKRKTGDLAGIEKFYNETLQQKPGELLIEKDAQGKLISQKIISLPKSGSNLVLWLDYDLQKKITEILKENIERVGATGAVACVIDVDSGGVLSLVSLPSFDNNLFSQGMTSEQWQGLNSDIRYPLINRVISGTYPSGSTIKPLIASAALQEEIISPQKKFNCKGEIKIKNKSWPDLEPEFWIYRDWSTHGWTDIRKAIAESCNVFFYTIGGGNKNFDGLGLERIRKYLGLFGWGEKTNIDLLEEKHGFLPSREWKATHFRNSEDKIWGRGNTYYLSIGQEFLLATPIQVAMSFTAIANGGKLLEPHIVYKIADDKEIEPKIIRQNFIDSQNLQIVRQGMRQAVSGENSPQASSVFLNSLPVKVAAKTGTAETGKTEKGKKICHNWIAVFAPYDNPQIVLTIMFENVKIGQAVAKPAAKEILEWYFTEQ